MEQVTASNLVKYNIDGNQVMDSPFQASPAAYNVHASVLKARPDIMCAVHTHTPSNLAVSAQKCGLLPITQQAMRFYKRIAYYKNEHDDVTKEGTEFLAKALGDKWVMILENHGALIYGKTLPEAYIYHRVFELACKAQIGAMAGGAEAIMPDYKVLRERVEKAGKVGMYNRNSKDWRAGIALADRLFPDYTDQEA